ncbi:MAG: tRNA (adenosine(37)-N6)-threonylcarbamoyltransferase complex dimerization subunit type 1 TsaB [Pseudomonadales bacterium]|nr:tRNA (adenosine(37)-N6)-threonylcarbamoyltransferase complex dimerization subunit type 1 TsaB [Pseudomonadales bacterium]
MNVLAIDTSSPACVLAISTGKQVYTNVEIVDRSHSKEILPRIVALIARAELVLADLDYIVFGQGPGSFTGLRIGVGVVQGLAFGLNIPVVAVSSMACLAQNQFRQHQHENCLVALTARLEEVYFGSYSISGGYASLNGLETVVAADQAPKQDQDKQWIGLGSGWQLRPLLEPAMGILTDAVFSEPSYPDPIDLMQLGMHRFEQGFAVAAVAAQPEYLREKVADLPAKPLPK